MNSSFKHWTHYDVVDLIHECPLAFMVSCPDSDFNVTPLPMMPETDNHGHLIRLIGHMALRNPHVDTLRRRPQARFLFLGPNGYVSPRLMKDRTWAPTWNYAFLSIETEIRFTPDRNHVALQRLVTELERGHPDAWSVDELGERFGRLSKHIVSFEADVLSIDATFKLGQDETPNVFGQILDGIESEALERWMRRFNQN